QNTCELDLEPAVLSQARRPANSLFEEAYGQLRQIAAREVGRFGENTLGATALVHELYMKLKAISEVGFESQLQVFSYAATAMRRILIDRARRRLTLKLGGSDIRIPLTAAVDEAAVASQQALQLDEALTALQQIDQRAARVVELHYFGGLSLHRVAEL